jgi:hypothetical protein
MSRFYNDLEDVEALRGGLHYVSNENTFMVRAEMLDSLTKNKYSWLAEGENLTDIKRRVMRVCAHDERVLGNMLLQLEAINLKTGRYCYTNASYCYNEALLEGRVK